jgi:hypothetical protein
VYTEDVTRSEEKLPMQQRLHNRREIVNKRFKQWKCLQDRHGVEKHSACFRAVTILTQLCIEHGEALFSVTEYTYALDGSFWSSFWW